MSCKLKRFATFNKIKNIVLNLDVKPTPSPDIDIKRDYRSILR